MTVVVLITPELFGSGLDVEHLKRTLYSAKEPVRLLVHSIGSVPAVIIGIVSGVGLEIDWLLGHDAAAPGAQARRLVHMVEGSSAQEQAELALALSDCVLAPSLNGTSPIEQRATELRKDIVVVGDALPSTASTYELHRGLDPDVPTPRRVPVCAAGRVEQVLLEVAGFSRDRDDKGRIKSLTRLRQCFGIGGLRPSAYFASGDWEAMAAARTEKDRAAPIRQVFECLDRSALYGSHVHRDVIWLTHALAAFAVFAAVAGSVFGHDSLGWPITELVVLLAIALITIWARSVHLQNRWTVCRHAAEQLRVARMCLPLLVETSALASVDKPPPSKHGSKPEEQTRKHTKWLDRIIGAEDLLESDFAALATAKRAVRDQGLPHQNASFDAVEGAAWLRLFVADQMTYHRNNHRKLALVEQRLLVLKVVVFLAAIGAVIAHFFSNAHWLLLFTASAPALAAAVHGAETRLGIVHRAALSEKMDTELNDILRQLDAKGAASSPSQSLTWSAVRKLARRAAEAMVQENTSWHSLVRRERDFIPA